MDRLSLKTTEDLLNVTLEGIRKAGGKLISKPGYPIVSVNFESDLDTSSKLAVQKIYDALARHYRENGWAVRRYNDMDDPVRNKRMHPLLISKEDVVSMGPGHRSQEVIGIKVVIDAMSFPMLSLHLLRVIRYFSSTPLEFFKNDS